MPTIPLAQKLPTNFRRQRRVGHFRKERENFRFRALDTNNHSIAKLTRTSSQYDANPCTILRGHTQKTPT